MTRFEWIIGAAPLTFAVAMLLSATALAGSPPDHAMSTQQATSNGEAVQKLSEWSAGPRLAGLVTIEKYGAPQEVTDVSALHEKHAAAFSEIVMLDGEAFGRAYLDFVVKAHSDAQNMIDERLAMTENQEVRKHLTATRKTITKHLQQAQELQGEATRTVSR